MLHQAVSARGKLGSRAKDSREVTQVFFSDEGPTLETLDYTVRIGSTPTFLYFDLLLKCVYCFVFLGVAF